MALSLGLRSWTSRKAMLLIASYVFYAAWNPPFVILLWLSTLVDWTIAKQLSKVRASVPRIAMLIGSLCTNLGLLAYFKYGGFIAENAAVLAQSLGLNWSPPAIDIVLPVGISFYTFQTLSYTIDVYRGKLERSQSFLDFALYVSFFPQLVAGPIVRADHFLPQCKTPPVVSQRTIGWGMCLMVIGVFHKLVIADALMSPIVESAYASDSPVTFISAWAGTFAFAIQIFCDFAGYSTCAIGVAMCLGFALPDNFRFPYAARGFSDFWRRWHISLSSWLRDYLYIPLGGNRHGIFRTYVHLMVTMLLGGLWHGASWNFVIWGGLHGAYLCLERLTARIWEILRLDRFRVMTAWLSVIATFLLVNIAWVFFRAKTLTGALGIVRAMFAFSLDKGPLTTLAIVTSLGVTVVTLAIHWFLCEQSLEAWVANLHPLLFATCLSMMIVLIVVCATTGQDRAFIYFQF